MSDVTLPEPTYAQLKDSRERWRHLAQVYQMSDWPMDVDERLRFDALLDEAYARLTHADITDDFREEPA